ncbi:hypothetical protein HYI12_02225 [Acinetobacter sp. SwsAc3]|nr:hypothetical protein [Acinetobacter sp. SwsAc3]
MKSLLIFLVLVLGFVTNSFSGYETLYEKKDQWTKSENERTQKYIESLLGKSAWFNSLGCTAEIYPSKSKISYSSPTYSTNNEYVPIKFESAELIKDMGVDYVLFKVTVDNKDEGYFKVMSSRPIGIDDYSYSCLKADKPPKKELIKAEENALLGWSFSCSKDKFNGAKSCFLHKMYGDVMVGVYDGQSTVYVGRDHYPGTKSAIKIDNNSTIYGYEGTSQTPKKVIEQMKIGKVAYTRYVEWPYEYNRDYHVDLTGFSEKYDEMLEAYKKL